MTTLPLSYEIVDQNESFDFFLLLFCTVQTLFRSNLRTTEAAGTYVTAVFWTAFAAGRFAAIFLAVYVNPLNTLLASLTLCLFGGISLVFLAQQSLIALQVCEKKLLQIHNKILTCDFHLNPKPS